MRTVIFSALIPLLLLLNACSLSLPAESGPLEGVLAEPRLFGQISENSVRLYWGYLDLKVPGSNLQPPEAFEIWSQVPGSDAATQVALVGGDVFSWTNDLLENEPRLWEVRALGAQELRNRSNQIMLSPGLSPRIVALSGGADLTRQEGIWSPDGRSVTFAARADSSLPWTLWRQDLFTRNTLELVVGSEPDINPENQSIVFVEGTEAPLDQPALPTRLGIWATAEISYLNLKPRHYRHPRWSRDGQWLLLQGQDEAGQELYLAPIQNLGDMEPVRFNLPALGKDLPLILPSGPQNVEWSTEGTGIYFSLYQAKEEGFARDIFLGNVIDGQVEALIASPWQDFAPSPSPDGRYLAFLSDRTGQLDIWLQEIATGTLQQLSGQADAPSPVANSRLTWSPDGLEILYNGQVEAELPDLYRLILP